MTENLGFALDLICTILAAACWYARPELGPWPLLLLALGRLLRFTSGGTRAFRPTAFDLPLLLFLVSAGIGVLIAYDQPHAQAKFWQITGGIALAGSLAHSPVAVRLGRWQVSPLRVFLAVVPAAIAGYFLLTNDWTRWLGKFPWLDPTMRWFASWQPSLPGHRFNPNLPGGAIAALIPLQAAVLFSGKPRGVRLALALALTGVAGLGVLLTASRGAWTALAVGLLTWWLLARSQDLRTAKAPCAQEGMAPAGVAAPSGGSTVRASLVPLLMLGTGVGIVALGIPQAVAGRLQLLHNGLDLALDYPFTGLGLGGFEMAYSTYVLLVHVGHTIHSHNLFLDVWIEQGLLGLLSLIWLIGVAAATVVRHLRSSTSGDSSYSPQLCAGLCLPAAAALIVILVHGLVDDAFYGSRAVMLLFVPFGVLAGVRLERGTASHAGRTSQPQAGVRLAPVYGLMLVCAGLVGALLLPSDRAAFQANLGALDQTRAELSVYEWPAWPIQDALRRSTEIDLRPAVVRYQAALALDPLNPTANRRLGQLALSLGQYDVARQHLEKAYAVAPGQRATRQMLGESYAIAGDPQRAADLWRTIDMSAGQVETRAWWYTHLRDPSAAERIRSAAALAAAQAVQPPITPAQ